MKRTIVATLLILNCAMANAGITDLAWLAGTWCGSANGLTSEESWLPPLGNNMIGLHRDVKSNKLVEFEYFRVVEEGKELVYYAQPNGKPPTLFRATSADNNRVDFVNPAHDFPKRITYQLSPTGELLVRIDGGTDASKHMAWKWTKLCGAVTK